MEGAGLGRYHPPMLAAEPSRGQSGFLQEGAEAGPVATLIRALRALSTRWWPEIAAALAAIVLYAPALGYGLVFDDLSLLDASGAPVALGGVVPYRPLRYASHFLDGFLGGSAVVAHAHNVLLHATVVALVVALARRLGAARPAALAGGLFVACHPVAVEAAAYVSGRRDLLCVALGLGALLAQVSGRPGRALAMVLLSAGAKESGLLFFAPLAAASALAGGPVLAIGGIAVVAAAMVLGYGAIGPFAPSLDLAGFALPGRVAAHYAASFVWPAALATEYPALADHVELVRSGDVSAIVVGVAGTAALLVAAVSASMVAVRLSRSDPLPAAPVSGWSRGGCVGRTSAMTQGSSFSSWLQGGGPEMSRRAVAFVLLWSVTVFVALAVWGGLHEPGADRHAYLLLPTLGVALAAALSRLLHEFPLVEQPTAMSSPKPILAALTMSVLLALAATTRAQMESWRSERTLWTRAVQVAPGSARAHANLARVLAADGALGRATRQLHRALAIDADVPHTWLGRAAVRCAQGRPTAARLDLVRALETGATSASVAEIGRECPLPEFARKEPAS